MKNWNYWNAQKNAIEEKNASLNEESDILALIIEQSQLGELL